MADNLRRRPLTVALVLAALAAGAGLGIVLSQDDDDDEGAATTAERQTATTGAVGETKTQTESTTTTVEGASAREEARRVEEAIVALVESSEAGDAPRLCDVLGVSPSGARSVQVCARAARVDLSVLPTSDELSIERVDVSGPRGIATLAGGTRIALRRAGREWKVTGLERGRSIRPELPRP
jgi:hypothetical protein